MSIMTNIKKLLECSNFFVFPPYNELEVKKYKKSKKTLALVKYLLYISTCTYKIIDVNTRKNKKKLKKVLHLDILSSILMECL